MAALKLEVNVVLRGTVCAAERRLTAPAAPVCTSFGRSHDVLIGTASLILALVIGRAGRVGHWRWRRIIVLMLLFGPAYTIFSEWLNTTLFRWSYPDLMSIIKPRSG